MSINAKIKDARRNADIWRAITDGGTWKQHNRTEIQAISLRERFEGRLEAFTEAKQLIKVNHD